MIYGGFVRDIACEGDDFLTGSGEDAEFSGGGIELGHVACADGHAGTFADVVPGDFKAEALVGTSDDGVETGKFHAGEPTVR